MEKAEFIKKLKTELRWQLDSKELHKVLREYEGYFDKASVNGADEASVAAELGEPALVATEILSERQLASGTSKRSTTGFLFAVAFFGFTAYTYVISPYLGSARHFFENNGMGYLNMFQLLLLTPTVLAFLVFPRIKSDQPAAVSRLVAANLTFCAIGTLCYTMMHQSLFLLINHPSDFAAHPVWGVIGRENLGSLFVNVLLLIALTVSGFTLAALVKVLRGGVMAIPLLYLNCTCIMLLYQYAALLRQLSDPAAYMPALYSITMLAALGLAITCVSFVALRLMMKGRARP